MIKGTVLLLHARGGSWRTRSLASWLTIVGHSGSLASWLTIVDHPGCPVSDSIKPALGRCPSEARFVLQTGMQIGVLVFYISPIERGSVAKTNTWGALSIEPDRVEC
jgi:hypothetical protein